MSKKKDVRTSFPRGTMQQIIGQKEKCNAYYGGLFHRIKAVGKSCADCLEPNCKANCGGIEEQKG